MAGGVDLLIGWPALGLVLGAAGAAMIAWAAWALHRAGNLPLPGAAPRRFVDDGPYAFTRNPMALGAVALLVGAGLVAAQPLGTLAGTAALALWLRRRVQREEAALRQAFGGWYSDYAAQVRRWI